MTLVHDGQFRLYKIPMGPLDNNAYILADVQSQECYIVDAPAEPEKILAEAQDWKIKGILMTHNHWDHLMGLEQLHSTTQAPVGIHDADKERLPFPPDFSLKDGDTLTLGQTTIKVFHTPGHTPGSVCLLAGNQLVSGDTLFPGGPGKTGSPQALRQVVQSIANKLLLLEDDVAVHPGHGQGTTIGQARQEHRVFASREHPADLCGDVLWLKN